MEISNLWTSWPICGPWNVSPLSGGTNNSVWRADAADGQSYVLHISPDLTRIPRIHYEAQLLQSLSNKNLPFLLPVPLRANNGDIVVLFEQEQGTTALATLSHLLPGNLQDRSPERDDPLSASHAGFTLALLDAALATLPDIQPPDRLASLPTFGQLAHWHPLASNPLAAVEQLPIDRQSAQQICTFLSDVLESVPHLYDGLPQQLLHRDYDPGNILQDHQHVTAVLDFEFAGRDIRVLDLCVALSWWPAHLLGTGKEWDLIDAFGAAYTRRFPLSEEELLAVPAIFRLRDATSFVHRMGRYLAGLETEERMQNRVQHSLWRQAWLSSHQQTLLQHVLAWN
jgi:Ser/Thr protein kinase RdoA (MazF antagonist)